MVMKLTKESGRVLKSVGIGVATLGVGAVGTALGGGILMMPIMGAGALAMSIPFAPKKRKRKSKVKKK